LPSRRSHGLSARALAIARAKKQRRRKRKQTQAEDASRAFIGSDISGGILLVSMATSSYSRGFHARYLRTAILQK